MRTEQHDTEPTRVTSPTGDTFPTRGMLPTRVTSPTRDASSTGATFPTRGIFPTRVTSPTRDASPTLITLHATSPKDQDTVECTQCDSPDHCTMQCATCDTFGTLGTSHGALPTAQADDDEAEIVFMDDISDGGKEAAEAE